MDSKVTLQSHQMNQANFFKKNIKPNFSEFVVEVPYCNKTLNERATIYVRLKNQYKYNYQTVLSATLDKQDEDIQLLYETEIFTNLKIIHNLAETDIDKIDIKSPLEHQFQQEDMKDTGWRFDKKISKTVYLVLFSFKCLIIFSKHIFHSLLKNLVFALI